MVKLSQANGVTRSKKIRKRKLRGYTTIKSSKDENGNKRVSVSSPVVEEPAVAPDEEIYYEDEEYEEEEHQVDAVIQLGSGSTPLHVDLEKLLKTRLLVVANSGGGKSFLLRQIAEKAGRFTTIIVIDIEGEWG